MSLLAPQGVGAVDYVNLAAGLYWPIFIGLALHSGVIRLGAVVPKIERAVRPGLYWSIITFLTVLTVIVWGLVAARFAPGLQGG